MTATPAWEGTETVRCGACGGAVRLSVASLDHRCPYCHAPVAIADEVRARLLAARTLIDRVAADTRRMASTHGRMMGMESSTLSFVAGLLLVSCGGFHAFASIWAVVDKGWDDAPPVRVFAPLAGLCAGVTIAVFAKLLQRYARRRFERVFRAAAPGDGAPNGACHLCGGPLPPATAEGAGVSRCPYCGADNVLGGREIMRVVSSARAALVDHVADMQRSWSRFRLVTMLTGYLLLGAMPVGMILADLAAASALG